MRGTSLGGKACWRHPRPGTESRVFEHRLRHKNGHFLYFESNCVNLLGDKALNAFVIRARDITQRKKTDEKYRSIFENAVEGIFQSSPEGRFASVNPAMARIFGYNSPEDLMETVTDVPNRLHVKPEQRREFLRIMLEGQKVPTFEAEMCRKDSGKTRRQYMPAPFTMRRTNWCLLKGCFMLLPRAKRLKRFFAKVENNTGDSMNNRKARLSFSRPSSTHQRIPLWSMTLWDVPPF